MRRLWFSALSLALLGGCSFQPPNGVFACVAETDCPSGYFCWNSDGRCYDAKEPELRCEPSSCADVVSEFASIGVSVECGVLPDGCEGVVECPPCEAGDTCGANGQMFMCGCEPNSCSSVGAECGEVEVGCGIDDVLDCGSCPGDLDCENNRCVCPEGQDCDAGCGSCADGEVCVEGECCAPLFPCAENQCSPPGGLPDGCGGFVECHPCADSEECELDPATVTFDCVDNCTCEAQGIECGTAALCGASQFCGLCGDPSAPLCDDGRCVCDDRFEPNDEPSRAARVDCSSDCKLADLQLEVEGTLSDAGDIDFYEIEVGHRSDWAVRVDVQGLDSTREIYLGYICPDGSEEISDCSGSSSSLGNSKYCIEDGKNTLRLVQACESSSGAPATVIVGIGSKEGEFRGPCDKYTLALSAYEYDD
jgi:hypothetical protein